MELGRPTLLLLQCLCGTDHCLDKEGSVDIDSANELLCESEVHHVQPAKQGVSVTSDAPAACDRSYINVLLHGINV